LKRPALAALGVAACLGLAPAASHAKVLDLWAGGHLGAVGGSGSGDTADADFFSSVHGAGAGFDFGAQLLFLNFEVRFTQVMGGAPGNGSLTQFLAGADGEIALDSLLRPVLFLRIGGWSGIALGTPAPVDLPLDNPQVSHKGFVVSGVAALDYHVNPFVTMGLEVSPGYHYFFPGGAAPSGDVAINDTSNNTRGMHFFGLLFVKAHVGL
jgi:hypothetical protein